MPGLAGSVIPDGSQSSAWPPVCETIPTAMRTRGPGTSPRSTACLTPSSV